MPRRRGLNRGEAPREAAPKATPNAARGTARRSARRALALAGALAAWLGAAPSDAATLREVRIGRHADYTRVVFETDAPVRYRLVREGEGELRVRLEASAAPRRVGSKSDVLREVVVERGDGAALARLALQRGDVDVREMVLENPPRIVLDLTPRGARTAARAKPAPPPRQVARAEPGAKSGKPAAEQGERAKRAREKPVVEVQKRERATAAAPPSPAPETVPAPAPATAPEGAPAPSAKPELAGPPAPSAATSPDPAELTGPPAPTASAELAGPPAPSAAQLAGRAAAAQGASGEGRPAAAPPSAESAGRAAAGTARAGEAATAPPARAPEGSSEAPALRAAPTPDPEPFDAAAERLARAERELEKLAGIPPHRRRDRVRALERPGKEGGARRERAERDRPRIADAREPAGETPDAAAAPGIGGEPSDAPRAEDPAAAPETGAGPSAADDPAAALRRAQEKAARVRAAQKPVGTPVAPGPLAFLPSPFDDPFVLAGIGVLLALIAALAVVRRRAALDAEHLPSPFDAADARAPGAEARAAEADAAAAQEDLGPLFASAAAQPSEPEGSIFDVAADEAVAEPAIVVEPPPAERAPAFEPATTAPAATAAASQEDEELTEEEMRLIEELERRLARIETRLEEVVDAKERLERHVAAQTEELRVQRAAIARTQRVLRTIVKPEDVATEPVSKT